MALTLGLPSSVCGLWFLPLCLPTPSPLPPVHHHHLIRSLLSPLISAVFRLALHQQGLCFTSSFVFITIFFGHTQEDVVEVVDVVVQGLTYSNNNNTTDKRMATQQLLTQCLVKSQGNYCRSQQPSYLYLVFVCAVVHHIISSLCK
eukprot:GHVS01005606.1.p2 GENE.GHVS01005606.1~~GHVS01005606.1.p2  ORF type:complete len:146 (+),score=34.66 GHVS01005606.1:1215-1652(+)